MSCSLGVWTGRTGPAEGAKEEEKQGKKEGAETQRIGSKKGKRLRKSRRN